MRIYFDHAASSPVRKQVIDFFTSENFIDLYNPSSVHFEGQKTRAKINDTRDLISSLLECNAENIVFTSSGTESCNYVINHALHTEEIENIIYLPTEHSAVLDTIFSKLVKRLPCQMNENGEIDLLNLDSILASLSGKTLVCAMLINNETGIIQPIIDISNVCQKYGALLFSDMIQSIGKLNTVECLKFCDYASFAAHKIGGLPGTGIAYLKDQKKVYKDVFGGEQEFGRRAGTENVSGIIAFGIAMEACIDASVYETNNIMHLYEHLTEGIRSISKEIIIPSIDGNKENSITTLIFPGLKSENLIIGMDMNNIAISAGAACSSGKIGGSHVLKSLNYDANQVNGAIRVSFGWNNTIDQVDYFFKVLNNLLKGMNFKY